MATALTAAAVLAAGGGAAGAAGNTSKAGGRFLSGSAGGTSFDTVAALTGETAKYPGDPGPNSNDLNGSVLGMAIDSPSKVQLPPPGGITFGAVAQYAKANSDGSSVGASGLIENNGTIGTGGSGEPKANATIDLSGLPSASAITSVLGNVKLELGAISARAQQAAIGKKLADPSADCTNPPYKRVSDTDQAGSYQFAGLKITANSPALKMVGAALTTTAGTIFDAFSTALSSLPGGALSVTGLPSSADLAALFTLSVAGGAITANLLTGDLSIDLAAVLKNLGLDLNNLCPNTSLLPYLATALADLPAALTSLLANLPNTLKTDLQGVTITVAGTPIPLSNSVVTGAITSAIGQIQSGLTSAGSALNTAVLTPIINALTSQLLNIVVNAQTETDHSFVETAVQLQVVPGGGALPAPPALPPLPVPTAPTAPPSLPTLPVSLPSISVPSVPVIGAAKANGAGETLLHAGRAVAAAPLAAPLAAPRASTLATTALIELDLASATVTNNRTTAATSSTSGSGASAGNTAIPTGVPAGQGTPHHGTPLLPLLLVLLGVVAAGGATVVVRKRGTATH